MSTPAKRPHATATERRASRSAQEEKRASTRVPVEGPVLIIREGEDAPQPAEMRDISLGGAFLETEPVPVGEEIRLEVAGEYSMFTMDAIVVRNRAGRRGKGTIAIRFVDRNPRAYADWLREECLRLSMWMCMDSAPLVAGRDPEIARASNDPVFIPVDSVFEIVESQPGTTLEDLLSLESFDEMHLRIAVARLIESRALKTESPPIEEKNEIYQARFRKRFPASLFAIGLRTAVAATIVVGVTLGVFVRYGGLNLTDPALAEPYNRTPISAPAAHRSAAPSSPRAPSSSTAPESESVPASSLAAASSQSAHGDPVSQIEVKKAYARAAGSVRIGPGKEFPSVEYVAEGDELLVVRKQGRWYLLAGDDDGPRWIHDSLVHMAMAP